MCEACNEAIKEMYSPSKQQKQHRIYEKEMLVYSAEPMDIVIDPEVDRKFNKANRNRQLAALGGTVLGTGLGVVAGERIGFGLSKGSDYAAGAGGAMGGFAGGILGARTGGRVADLLQAPDYAAYSAELNKNIRNKKKKNRIQEKQMMSYTTRTPVDIDPEVDRKFNKAMRNRKLAKLGGTVLGTGLGVVAGARVGGSFGSQGLSGFSAGYGSALGGVIGSRLGARAGGRVSDLLHASDYAALEKELRKNLPNA